MATRTARSFSTSVSGLPNQLGSAAGTLQSITVGALSAFVQLVTVLTPDGDKPVKAERIAQIAKVPGTVAFTADPRAGMIETATVSEPGGSSDGV